MDRHVAPDAPLPWLRAFEASARHLSFTNAASELEPDAGGDFQTGEAAGTLPERTAVRTACPRSLALTKVGAAYLPKVQDAFERLSAGTLEVFGGRTAAMLSVRAPIGYAVNWLAARLPHFMAAHPKTPSADRLFGLGRGFRQRDVSTLISATGSAAGPAFTPTA